MLREPIKPVQIAYHVPDPERAAHEFSRQFGWGPFFLAEHIALSSCSYRGAAANFDHSSAYGQAGELMIELITQHDDSPSVLRDLFARDAVGVHHVAQFVPDLAQTLQQFEAAGTKVAMDACTASGTRFVMLDLSRNLGHMLELYEPSSDLLKFYRFVRRASEAWDGSEALRRLKI